MEPFFSANTNNPLTTSVSMSMFTFSDKGCFLVLFFQSNILFLTPKHKFIVLAPEQTVSGAQTNTQTYLLSSTIISQMEFLNKI